MSSKFQKAITEIRNQVVLQGAETVARLKQIEVSVSEKIGEINERIVEINASVQAGLESSELALIAQTERTVASFDGLLSLIAGMERPF